MSARFMPAVVLSLGLIGLFDVHSALNSIRKVYVQNESSPGILFRATQALEGPLYQLPFLPNNRVVVAE
jgi:hypothetical protein